MDKKKKTELDERLESEDTVENQEAVESENIEEEEEEEEEIVSPPIKKPIPKVTETAKPKEVWVVYKGTVAFIASEGVRFKNSEPQKLSCELADKICKHPHFRTVDKIKE